jgi:hypothetical protein
MSTTSSVPCNDITTYDIEHIDNKTFNDASPAYRKSVVEAGLFVLDNVTCTYSTKDDTSNEELERQKQYYETMLSNVREDVMKARTDRETYADERVESKTREMQVKIDMYTERIAQIQQDSVTMQRRAEVEMADLKRYNTQLETMVQTVIDRQKVPEYKNNTEKGRAGERAVEEYLESLPGTYTWNKSDNAMCCDIRCDYQGTKSLIECKNYTRNIPKREVEKFRRDVRANDVDAAIMVSIVDGVRIPHMNKFHIEMHDGRIPCVYITNFESNPWQLEFALNWIVYYVRHVRKGGNMAAKFYDRVSAFYTDLTKTMDHVGNMKRMIQGLSDETGHLQEQMKRGADSLRVALEQQLRFEDSLHTTPEQRLRCEEYFEEIE